MAGQKTGMHETMEVHELMAFKTVCCATSTAMKDVVNDSQLKSLLEQDANKAKQHLKDLQNLVQGSAVGKTDNFLS